MGWLIQELALDWILFAVASLQSLSWALLAAAQGVFHDRPNQPELLVHHDQHRQTLEDVCQYLSFVFRGVGDVYLPD